MTEFISPIEVFEAELGDPAPLSALLRSDKSLDKRTRVAIAMLIEGRLDRHKKDVAVQINFKIGNSTRAARTKELPDTLSFKFIQMTRKSTRMTNKRAVTRESS
jgi:hypothetical protein